MIRRLAFIAGPVVALLIAGATAAAAATSASPIPAAPPTTLPARPDSGS
ncbi:MAG: hypothetical protein ACXVWF_06170 [Actinomycetota bacterium]